MVSGLVSLIKSEDMGFRYISKVIITFFFLDSIKKTLSNLIKLKYFNCKIGYGFWHVVLISHDIGPWYNKRTNLQVDNNHS